MKAWSIQVAFVALLFICCAASNAVAQDAGMSDVEIPADDLSAGDHSSVFVPGEEARFVPRASGQAPNDSLSLQMQDFPMQRAAQRPAERASEKQSAKGKDDSVLTFNFLYYIIQKYKLQDIID